jgi:iron-sulfur cluster assembly protein
MIRVTDNALDQIRHAVQQGQASGMALRVAARRADDGSIEYGMGFDDTHDDDLPLDYGDLTVVVASSSRTLLAGTTLDYVELEPGQHRFIFVPSEVPGDTPAASCGSGGCPSCRSGCASGGTA